MFFASELNRYIACKGGNMNFEEEMEVYKQRRKLQQFQEGCSREYWDGNQIKLSPSHADCPNYFSYDSCPDPTVITMRNRI